MKASRPTIFGTLILACGLALGLIRSCDNPAPANFPGSDAPLEPGGSATPNGSLGESSASAKNRTGVDRKFDDFVKRVEDLEIKNSRFLSETIYEGRPNKRVLLLKNDKWPDEAETIAKDLANSLLSREEREDFQEKSLRFINDNKLGSARQKFVMISISSSEDGKEIKYGVFAFDDISELKKASDNYYVGTGETFIIRTPGDQEWRFRKMLKSVDDMPKWESN